MNFSEKLTQLLNEFGWDAKIGLPDFVLAEQIEANLQSQVQVPENPEPPSDEVESPIGTPPKPTD